MEPTQKIIIKISSELNGDLGIFLKSKFRHPGRMSPAISHDSGCIVDGVAQ
jgi:hypothetical protein